MAILKVLNFVLLIKVILLSVSEITVAQTGDPCIKTDTCRCESKDGYLDLTPLQSVGKQPRFEIKDPLSSYTYTWSPCVNSPVACGVITSDVAACQTESSTGYLIGRQSTGDFSGEAGKNLKLIYTNYDASIVKQRETHILLTCDTHEEGLLVFKGESPNVHYNFELKSKHACLHTSGLSTGSILLIVFFVLVVVYIVGGILFLRFIRGARGTEMIPNLEKWKEVPFLIKKNQSQNLEKSLGLE